MRGDCHAERTISWRVEKCVNVLVYNWFYLTILGKALFTQKILTIKAQKEHKNKKKFLHLQGKTLICIKKTVTLYKLSILTDE